MRVERIKLLLQKNILILLTVTVIFSLSGCASSSYPDNVVAVVNKETITEKDIEDALKERELNIEIFEMLQEINGAKGSISPREAMLQSFGITEEEMTPDQKRFFDDVERTSTKMLDANEALNILLTEKIFYQEAVKQGHNIPVERAKQVLEESKAVNMEMLAQDEEALKEYKDLVERLAPIYQKYGFASEDDYLNQRIDKTARSMTVNSMNRIFNEIVADKLPGTDPQQIELANAWTDYGEFLLSKAKVKILKPEYSIVHYGESWKYEELNLKLASK